MGRLTALPRRLGALGPRLAPAVKVAESFYLSREWRDLVGRLKRERGAWCAKCGAGGRIIGDHVTERRDGGAELDAGNVELLCMKCHARKTAAARKARAEGRGGGRKSGRT